MEQIRNFKDFLRLYNQITDTCFTRCIYTLNSRKPETKEGNCVDLCANKFIRSNHRIMQTYLEVQATIVEKRIEEMNAQAAAQEQKLLQEQNQIQNSEKTEVPNISD